MGIDSEPNADKEISVARFLKERGCTLEHIANTIKSVSGTSNDKWVIKDSAGAVVGLDGYHEVSLFKERQLLGVVGERGAMHYWIVPGSTHPMNGKVGFHDFIYYDERLQHLVACLGAMNYIVDPHTGFPISDGYHEIPSNVSLYTPQLGLKRFLERDEREMMRGESD